MKSNKRPFYCGQDLRDLVGYTITDVKSDKDDSNVKVILQNMATGHRASITGFDRALDGETLFLTGPNISGGHTE